MVLPGNHPRGFAGAAFALAHAVFPRSLATSLRPRLPLRRA